MNAAGNLSTILLGAYEEEQALAAAQREVKREPTSGRIHHEEPFGGAGTSMNGYMDADGTGNETQQRTHSMKAEAGFERTRMMSVMPSSQSQVADAWACHPAGTMAQRAARAGTIGPGAGGEGDRMQPILGWYGEEAGEEGKRMLATMQARLNQRLGPEYISHRAGAGGGNLSYLEGWKAIDLANDVFGFNGWSTSIVRLDVDYLDMNNGRVNCGVSCILRITLRDGTFHEDVGYGVIENAKGKAAALEKTKKEAVTDALKRSLKTFGRLTGNCLYDKKFIEVIKKMKPDPEKIDVNQLHRRSELPIYIKPDPEDHQDFSDVSMSSANGSSVSYSRTPVRAASMAPPPIQYRQQTAAPTSTNASVPTANPPIQRASTAAPSVEVISEEERLRINEERRAAALKKQAEYQARLAGSSATPSTGSSSPQDGSSEQTQAVRRPPAVLKRAPAAQPPPSPPKKPSSDPASKVYGKEPGAKWARKPASHDPPTATPGGFDESDLSAAVAAFDASQGSNASSHAMASPTKTTPAAQPPAEQRRTSSGHFISNGNGNSNVQNQRSSYGVTSLSAASTGRNSRGPSPDKQSGGGGGGGSSGAGAGGFKRVGDIGEREPLRSLDVDEEGTVKRQRR